MLVRTIEGSGLRSKIASIGIGLVGAATRPVRHRGLGRFCRDIVGRLIGPDPYVTLRLSPDSVMKVSIGDPYWGPLVSSAVRYEPELELVLARIKALDFGFIDAGANFGYWTILASSEAFGRHRSVAIEASSRTFEHLMCNLRLNGNRFMCVNRAVSRSANSVVRFATGRNHASASFVPGAVVDCVKSEDVSTCTIDEVASEYFPTETRFVLKLDVEGAEIQAFAGATAILQKDTLLIYEDHGRDLSCQTTAAVLHDLRKEVFFVDARKRRPVVRRIRTVAEARQVKETKSLGYNFFACAENSEFRRAFG